MMAFQEMPVSIISDLSSFSDDKVLTYKSFMSSTNDISSGAVGGSETAQLLISNPSNSGLKMKIWKMIFQTNVSTNNNIFRLYSGPTVSSNGTALPNICTYLDGSNAPSLMNLFKVPTVSANGNLMMNIIAGPTTSVPVNFDKNIILKPGYKLLVGVRPNTTGVTYSIDTFWIEET